MPVVLKNKKYSRAKGLNGFGEQSGFSLIEVLVSLFVLAIGLLGVIAMQINGVKSNQRAQFSSEVQLLAADFVDRIYAYDDVDDDTDNNDYQGLKTVDDFTLPDCKDTGCAAAQQRVIDMFEWKTELESRLPAGRGTIEYDGDRQVYTLTVMWDNERTGVAGTACSGDPSVDLSCHIVEVSMR